MKPFSLLEGKGINVDDNFGNQDCVVAESCTPFVSISKPRSSLEEWKEDQKMDFENSPERIAECSSVVLSSSSWNKREEVEVENENIARDLFGKD